MEKKKKRVLVVGPSLTSREIFLIYRAWFTNLPLISVLNLLILGIKYVILYQGLIFQEMDLETRKLADKYLFYVFSTFVCLSITNFLYSIGWPTGVLETLDGPP